MLHKEAALVSAVRPSVLRDLANTTSGVIIVLPDDAETFAPVPVLTEPTEAVTLLATRFCRPPLDGKLPDAVDTASHGRIDQDILALRADDQRALDFLDAWTACLIRSPHVGRNRLDQTTFPWLDSLANLPGVRSVCEPTAPISIRNADEPERNVAPSLVRWPGFDPRIPWILSAETGALPRVRPTTHPALAALAEARSVALLPHRAGESASSDERALDELSGAFSHLPNGLVLTDAIRDAYAAGLQQFEAGNTPEPPNPFADDSNDDFLTWLTSADVDAGPSRYVAAFRRCHPELDDVLHSNDELTAWFNDGGVATGVPRELRPLSPTDRSAGSSDETSGPPAIEISGYLGAAFGMGAAARALVTACDASGIATYTRIDRRTAHYQDVAVDDKAAAESPTAYTVLVLVRNADALLADPSDAVAARNAGRKVVGLWFWEVETFPDRLRPAFVLLDEIWVATEFVANSLRAHTDCPPVHVFPFPLPIPLEHDVAAGGAELFSLAQGVDEDRFVVSFSFDFDSIADRKNPWAAVSAYRSAFPDVVGSDGLTAATLPDGRRPFLILKAIGGERHPLDRDRLEHAIGKRTDVMVIDGHLDPDLQRGLFARTNVYLSLHRGEGLGLTVAEAMAAGAPVVVTDYAGTTSFCTADNAFLVPHTLVDIPLSTPVYAGCGQWAEPDVATAATYLRTIANADEPAATIRSNATRMLRERRVFTDASGPAFIAERVRALLATWVTSATDPSSLASTIPNRVMKIPPTAGSAITQPAPMGRKSAAGRIFHQPANRIDDPSSEFPVPTLEPLPATSSADATGEPTPLPAGLGPVVLPGASVGPPTHAGGVLGAVGDRVRHTVEPMIAAQAAFEQARVVALVDAVQQTRQAVLDLEANARAERQTLTNVIGGVQSHVNNVQAGHDALYATVTELSTSARKAALHDNDLQQAVERIDARLDEITRQLNAMLRRLG